MRSEKQNPYAEHENLRREFTDKILNADSNKRIILAGPGTGKSFLFQEICQRNIEQGKENNLTLTFINELVDDLSKDLYKLSDVKTLHSFALGLIPGDKRVFIKLGEIIGDDYRVVTDEVIDYNSIFCNLKDEKEELEFYSKRRRYYDFFSPNCSVYTLLKIFEREEEKIPEYSQVLVDEFQDFNKLESRLIDYLAQKNPILLVGDDDQSLYDFKHANPNHIRSKYSSSDYSAYELPYCSRCTRVILDAFSRVVDRAQSEGFLKERMVKDYRYFPSKGKDAISNQHNKIAVKRKVYQTVIAYNIDNEIEESFDPRSEYLPSLLIICPFRKQIEPLERALRKKGFKNIDASQKIKSEIIIEGVNLLLNDSKCNLGWRIVFRYICDKEQKEERYKQVIKESVSTGKNIVELLEADEKKYVKKLIASLRKIRDNKPIAEEDQDLVFDCFDYNLRGIATNKVKSDLGHDAMPKHIYKNTPIKIATILGSKGLTTDYTFLVNFDDKYLLDHAPDGSAVITDVSICKFLVALTRAKTKTYIYTSENALPTYLKWIGDEFIEEQR